MPSYRVCGIEQKMRSLMLTLALCALLLIGATDVSARVVQTVYPRVPTAGPVMECPTPNTPGQNYSNPVQCGFNNGDPGIMSVPESDGSTTFYIFTSSGNYQHSKDMVTWSVQQKLDYKLPVWFNCSNDIWGIKVLEWEGKWLLYYSARWALPSTGCPSVDCFGTDVLEGESVTGPFRPPVNHTYMLVIGKSVSAIGPWVQTMPTGEGGKLQLHMWYGSGTVALRHLLLSPSGIERANTSLGPEDLNHTPVLHMLPADPVAYHLEGPAIWQRDGWSYLWMSGAIWQYSNPGNYQMLVARTRGDPTAENAFDSSDIRLLAAGDANIASPGHNSLIAVTCADGTTEEYSVFGGFRRNVEFEKLPPYPNGAKPVRDVFIQRVLYTADGWPTFAGNATTVILSNNAAVCGGHIKGNDKWMKDLAAAEQAALAEE